MGRKLMTSKICTKCKIEKAVSEFYFRSDSNRYILKCKECIKSDRRAYRKTEAYAKVRDAYYADPEVKQVKYNQHRKWVEKEKDKIRAFYRSTEYKERKRAYYTDPSRGKPLYNARTVKRRAAKLQRTPPWLTKAQHEEMTDIYKQAKELEAIFFNRKFHVDHIIPLQGKDVCGLHVPWNLQILTAEENLQKGNRHG
jgi:5-methylcytosine-specific restriction endonuclease McrA